MHSSNDWRANDWHLGSRAVGGFAPMMADATELEARGRITPRDAGLWEVQAVLPNLFPFSSYL
jgi:hypothetical protein